jgi:elongation factor 1-beta
LSITFNTQADKLKMSTTSVADLAKDLGSLNGFLATRSYVTGYAPTSDDSACFEAVGAAPNQAKYLHAARWYKHISSFTEAQRKAFAAGAGSVTVQAPKSPVKAAAPKKEAPKKKEEEEEEDEDDLFGSGTEEEKAHEAALKAKAAAARAGKPEKEKPKQRSLIVLEIKPNEMETDLEALAKKIKENVTHVGIQNWGAEHKLIPIAFGIKKLAISVVVWDDDIDTEQLEEMITELAPDDIQSIDVAAMSKV